MERAKLAAARYDEGWSQETLAEHVGVTRSTISQWERGLTHPYPIHVKLLCKLFGKSAEDLGLGKQVDSQLKLEELREEAEPKNNMDTSRREFIIQNIPMALGYTLYPHLLLKSALHETLEAYQSLLPIYWEASYTSSRANTLEEIEVIIQDLSVMIIYGNTNQQRRIQECLCHYHQLANETARDQGYLDHALHHADLATLLATKIEHTDFLTACLYRRGLTHFDRGDMLAAAHNLRDALPFASNAGRQLRGMINIEAARFQAHTLPDSKEELHINHLLDQAQAIIDNDSLQDDASFVKLDKGRYHIGRAATLLALKDATNSRKELDNAAQLTKQEYKRRHAYITILRAKSHFIEGDFDYATDLAIEAAQSCIAIQSKSNLADVQRLHSSLVQTTYKYASKTAQLGVILRSQK